MLVSNFKLINNSTEKEEIYQSKVNHSLVKVVNSHLHPVKHTILKVKFLFKNSILTKPQRFHNFFDNFSRELKVVNS